MRVVECEWNKFIQDVKSEILRLREETYYHNRLMTSPLLFRGQENTTWNLESTLDRFLKDRNLSGKIVSERYYHEWMSNILPYFLSLTQHNFEREPYEIRDTMPPLYRFMIYLRHHGYPSPLLDWSESPYVAAFFAFHNAKQDQGVAIFSYRQYWEICQVVEVSAPTIYALEPMVTAHPRHFSQHSSYTRCYKKDMDSGDRIYSSHEDGISSNGVDIVTKYVLPGNQRTEILEELDLMNINAYTLFGTEEGLASSVAFRYLERQLR